MHHLVLLTGSNVGDSLANLQTAARYIAAEVGSIQKQSSVYKTAPWGNTKQQDFLNQVLWVDTEKSAREALVLVLAIEQKMGRVREQKWAPRTIDIDILFYDDAIIQESDLQVPHPLLHLRKFTLQPLLELDPNFIHPLFKQSIAQLSNACPDESLVEKL